MKTDKNPPGYTTVATFHHGEVLASAKRIVVLGAPVATDDDDPGAHNCDAMGCGSVGLHVVAIVDRPPPPPPEAAPVEEPRVDIKAARKLAEAVVASTAPDAERHILARALLACTSPDLAAAVKGLPDAAPTVATGGEVDVEEIREALTYHLEPYAWTAEHMDEQHWIAVQAVMPRADELLDRCIAAEAGHLSAANALTERNATIAARDERIRVLEAAARGVLESSNGWDGNRSALNGLRAVLSTATPAKEG